MVVFWLVEVDFARTKGGWTENATSSYSGRDSPFSGFRVDQVADDPGFAQVAFRAEPHAESGLSLAGGFQDDGSRWGTSEGYPLQDTFGVRAGPAVGFPVVKEQADVTGRSG